MSVPEGVRKAVGRWVGSSRLHLSWLPDGQRVQESASILEVRADPRGAFAMVEYTWSTDEGPQSGRLLLSGSESSGEVTGGWSDSWHQDSAVMPVNGQGMSDGAVKLAGKYNVEGHPDWGWRLEFEFFSPDALEFRMFNVSPEGDEEWAVQADYRRA